MHFVYAPEDKINRLEFKTSLTMKLQSEKRVKCITKVLTQTGLTVFITRNIVLSYTSFVHVHNHISLYSIVLYYTCVDSTTILLAALLNTWSHQWKVNSSPLLWPTFNESKSCKYWQYRFKQSISYLIFPINIFIQKFYTLICLFNH